MPLNEKTLRAMTTPTTRFGGDRVHLSTYLPGEVYETFEKLCAKRGYSHAAAIRAAVGEWMIREAAELRGSKS